MTHDTQELVARLRNSRGWRALRDEAAVALTAQAWKIRALRERNAEMEAALRELLGILEIASVMPDAIQKVYVPKMDAPELSRARAALAGKGEA